VNPETSEIADRSVIDYQGRQNIPQVYKKKILIKVGEEYR
jgi:hypothetical protein